jgi:polysaccharide biosynthesis transport protein
VSNQATDLPSSLRPFGHYLEIPKRRPWHIVIPCLTMAIAGLGLSFLATKMYRTSTMILIEAEKVPESIVQQRAEDPNRPRILTIRQEILSRTRIESVMKDLNPYPEAMGHEPLTSIVETLRRAADVSVKGTEAFTIDFVHSDPKMAMLVANRLASSFIDETVASREAQVVGAAEFLDVQLGEARKQLEAKELEVRHFKERHIGQLPEQTPANLATLERLQLDRQSIEASLSAARQRELMLQRTSFDVGVSPTTGAVTLDPGRDLNKAREELAALRTRYTDEHPDVRALHARIAKLERDDAQSRQVTSPPTTPTFSNRAELEKVRTEIRQLEGRKSNVEQQMGVFQGRVEQAPRSEQEIQILTRDLGKLNENYSQLLTKRLDAQMRQRMEKRWRGERFRILDPAY